MAATAAAHDWPASPVTTVNRPLPVRSSVAETRLPFPVDEPRMGHRRTWPRRSPPDRSPRRRAEDCHGRETSSTTTATGGPCSATQIDVEHDGHVQAGGPLHGDVTTFLLTRAAPPVAASAASSLLRLPPDVTPGITIGRGRAGRASRPGRLGRTDEQTWSKHGSETGFTRDPNGHNTSSGRVRHQRLERQPGDKESSALQFELTRHRGPPGTRPASATARSSPYCNRVDSA